MSELLSAMTLSRFLSAAGALTLATGLVLAIVLAADLALARRVSASVRAALYVAVFVRVALPVDWTSPMGLLDPKAQVAADAPPGAAELPTMASPAVAAPAPAAVASRALPVGRLVHVGVGVSFAAAWWVARRRTARSVADATPAGERLATLASGLPVVEHPRLGPAVFGLVRPRIVVPSGLVATLTDDALRAVLAHEAAHLRRRDPLLLFLIQLAVCVAWPVLPAWIAAWRVRGLVEQSCDEVVLARADGRLRRTYGEALLAVAQWQPMPARLALGMVAFGGGPGSRLRALRFTRRWPGWLQAPLALGVLLVAVLGGAPRPVRATAAAAGVPPLVVVDMRAWVGAGELPASATAVSAVEGRFGRTVVAKGRLADLQAALGPTRDATPQPIWLGGWLFTNMRLDQFRPGARLAFRTAPTIADGSLAVTIGLPAAEGGLVDVPVSLLNGEAVLVHDAGTIAVVLAPANVTWADGSATVSSPRLTLDVREAPLSDALAEIEKQAGLPLLVEVPTERHVTLAAADLPIEEVVTRLAAAAGAQARVIDGRVGFVAPDAVEPALDGRLRAVLRGGKTRILSLRRDGDEVLVRAQAPAASVPDVVRALEAVGTMIDVAVTKAAEAASTPEVMTELLARLAPLPEAALVRVSAEIWRVPADDVAGVLAQADLGVAASGIGMTAMQRDKLVQALKDRESRGQAELVSRPTILQRAGERASVSTGSAGGAVLELGVTATLEAGAIALTGDVTSRSAAGGEAKAAFSALPSPGLVPVAEADGQVLLVVLDARAVAGG